MNSFTVIDTLTGQRADYEKIAQEPWARRLLPNDIDQFYAGEDGTLILMDECGSMAYAPAGRFELVAEEQEEAQDE